VASWSNLLALVVPIGLTACASGNVLQSVEKDRSIITGSISPSPVSTGSVSTGGQVTDVSDAETIRNAVTSVDPTTIDPDGLAWANPATGASGRITGLTEFQDSGGLCRRFSATMTRFDGVSLYRGEACLQNPGGWRLRAFAGS
jgi:hypothetical protein